MQKHLFVPLALLVLMGTANAGPDSIPTGPLPHTIRPTAYRIALTVDPAAQEFTGHTEIDAVLTEPARSIFLHGNGLRMRSAQVKSAGPSLTARYEQVDDSGVARLDLLRELPPGKLTLTFDYTAAFRTGAEGLFHAQVAGNWYAWTQMEPIDARRVFPGFDEPGFKTPFTVTVTAPKNLLVFANTHEVSSTPAGAMTVHHFAPTPPLPTYLVAIGVGPFDVVETTVPPNAVRKRPLPFRVIATKGQKPRMRLAAAESPKLLALLETYLGLEYPFEKLDLLGTPLLGGAMENAGLIISDDTLMLLDEGAPFSQLRAFGEVTAHEMAHQWFGDLVTPSWWTDIWLNESFAEWLGKKVGDEWRPDLDIGASALADAFDAMETDSLGTGRPIRQPITENRQIASAFDSITYQKGAQVLSMFESYVGPERFAQGVRLHLQRYRHGNATADDFFRSLGEAAGDSKIVAAMRTFTDQTGVPVVTLRPDSKGLTVTQTRYRPLGVSAGHAQTWIIPLCIAEGVRHLCTLLDKASSSIEFPSDQAALIPNARGAGYYRFRLDDVAWRRLIAAAGQLPGREALALADSVWADFAAGTGSFDRVLAAARALSGNAERLAVIELGYRLKELADTALAPDQVAEYRKLMQSIYGPRLAALGTDVRRGAYTHDPIDDQALRQSLLPLVALEARDPALRKKLAKAAVAYLDGDEQSLDPAFVGAALSVAVQDLGIPFMTKLHDALVKSTAPWFRNQACGALGSADTPELAQAALRFALSPGVQSIETLEIVIAASRQPGARDTVANWMDTNFERVMHATPGFAHPIVVRIFNGYCDAADAAKVDALIKPKLPALGGGELELAQVKQRIGLCAALKKARGAEVASALAQATASRTVAMP